MSTGSLRETKASQNNLGVGVNPSGKILSTDGAPGSLASAVLPSSPSTCASLALLVRWRPSKKRCMTELSIVIRWTCKTWGYGARTLAMQSLPSALCPAGPSLGQTVAEANIVVSRSWHSISNDTFNYLRQHTAHSAGHAAYAC